MENQRQKWVNLVFTATAILVAVIAFVGLSKMSAIYNLESSIKQIDLVVRLVAIVIGAAVGLGLYWNNQSNVFMNEVVLELSRVTWPTSKEATNATIWVMLFVIAAGAFLGALDALWSWMVKLIL